MISICINTKDRPQQLKACLAAIASNRFTDYEILIVDQGKDLISSFPGIMNIKKLKYFRHVRGSVGDAKNLAVAKSSGKIVVFTDDDCIVPSNWLQNIADSFRENHDIAGLFGKVLPYNSSGKKNMVCPSTFLNNKRKIITKPSKHWKNIGLGNNMAFRKKVFQRCGGFKSWLGPGSAGLAAEDGEFALRLLVQGNILLYNPRIRVYHNRWLTREQYKELSYRYTCGEMACYGYYFFQRYDFAHLVIRDNINDSIGKFLRGLKLLLQGNFMGYSQMLNFLQETFIYRLRGFFVGVWFGFFEPLNFFSYIQK